MNKMERIATLLNELQDFVSDGVLLIRMDQYGKKEVLLNQSTFFDSFIVYDVEERSEVSQYQYEVSVEIEDTRFLTLIDDTDYDKYVKGAKLIEIS